MNVYSARGDHLDTHNRQTPPSAVHLKPQIHKDCFTCDFSTPREHERVPCEARGCVSNSLRTCCNSWPTCRPCTFWPAMNSRLRFTFDLCICFPDLLRWFEFLCGACRQEKGVQGQTSAIRIPFALACNPGCRLQGLLCLSLSWTAIQKASWEARSREQMKQGRL